MDPGTTPVPITLENKVDGKHDTNDGQGYVW